MIPVCAPARVAERVRSAADAEIAILHRGRDALYFAVDGWCVGLVSAGAVAVPCALTTRLRDLSAMRADSAYLREGVLHLDGTPLVVGRIVDVGVHRLDPEGIARSTADSATSLVVPPITVTEFVVPLALPPRLGPDHVRLLVGRGEGLTPLGDDLLCGWLATHRAAGVATPLVDAAVRAHLSRTTLLSATLLEAALHGEALPEFNAHLAALGTRAEAAATSALCSVGHTSGGGLLVGSRLALTALSQPIGCAA